MAKNSPGTLNSKTVRISLHTYLLLKEISEHSGSSIAEALDKLLLDTDHIPEILMPVVTRTARPVTAARSTPVTSARPKLITIAKARSTPVTIAFSREVKYVNGNRRVD